VPRQTNPAAPPAAEAGDGGAAGAQAKAQEKAQAAAGQAQAKVREQLDQRCSQVADQINEQASDLRSVSGALREQGREGPAKAADRVAEYAERVGGYLRERDSDALLGEAEDFGRRQPAAVAAGGFVLGFLASRFLKASSRQRYSSRSAAQLPPPRPAVPPRAGPGSRVAGSRPRTPDTAPVAGLRPRTPDTAPPASGVPPVRSGV
jgi:hypothetical protein